MWDSRGFRRMSSWQERILGEFIPGAARTTLVSDPDGLLSDESILVQIRERGFEVIPYEDPVTFRYAYESRIRARRDRGGQVELAVMLASSHADFDSLPHDLLETGRRLSFSVGDLFPNLSRSVVAALEPGDLDGLYDAQQRHGTGILGDDATAEFALRHVFGIVPELIVNPSDLLSVLLRRHYAARKIPPLLDEHLIARIRRSGEFSEWPLDVIVPDRNAFLAFLQERWPVFLDRLAHSGSVVSEAEGRYALSYPGPAHLPFDHDDVRAYVDSLFLERQLRAVPHVRAASLSETWVAIGLRTDEAMDELRRMERLLETAEATIPEHDDRHEKWFRFAAVWAELNALELVLDSEIPDSDRRKIETLRARVDIAFAKWIGQRYQGLVNLPPVPPVMLHHLSRFLARKLHDSPQNRVALLVVDGLSLDQWVVVRQELTRVRPDFHFHEGAVFAWIPTVTSVSRQAIFAGRPPLYFPKSIHSTDREPALWQRFWADEGVAQSGVRYAKSLGGEIRDDVAELIADPAVRVAGLVVDTVDKIMHGMPLGTAGMHNLVRLWARKPQLAALLDLLLENDFLVFLTSDHGNIEAAGCGSPSEGAVAELRGERVRVYRDASLRRGISDTFPAATDWPPIGLPEDYLPLLAPNRLAFVREGQRIVGHGGASIEELIVPLVRIERQDT